LRPVIKAAILTKKRPGNRLACIRLQKILPKEDFVGTVTGTCGQ